MSVRATTLQDRFLPGGPLDLLWQVLLFVAAFLLYLRPGAWSFRPPPREAPANRDAALSPA